ncbi:MAG: GreA/GreB family elongation factor [Verrucomicrobiota bacterium]
MNLSVVVSERDARRLRLLIQARKSVRSDMSVENLHRLERELARARIVPDAEFPEEVIAMDSIVELEDMDNGELMTYTLVFPENADITRGYVSILAPLGTAMLGYRVGDEFEWPVPGGKLWVRVRKLLGRLSPAAYRPDFGKLTATTISH